MTNWAYGITVGLTIASGMAMLMASGADRAGSQAVQQRDADLAVRELLARMTQRLQGCESFEDVVKVAELFAPNIALILNSWRKRWVWRCATTGR